MKFYVSALVFALGTGVGYLLHGNILFLRADLLWQGITSNGAAWLQAFGTVGALAAVSTVGVYEHKRFLKAEARERRAHATHIKHTLRPIHADLNQHDVFATVCPPKAKALEREVDEYRRDIAKARLAADHLPDVSAEIDKLEWSLQELAHECARSYIDTTHDGDVIERENASIGCIEPLRDASRAVGAVLERCNGYDA